MKCKVVLMWDVSLESQMKTNNTECRSSHIKKPDCSLCGPMCQGWHILGCRHPSVVA